MMAPPGMDKQRSITQHTKTNDKDTRTLLKTGGEFRCSESVSSSCSTSGTRRFFTLAKNTVICHKRGKDLEVFTTGGIYPWSFATQIFHIGEGSHCENRKTVKVMISTLGSVASLLTA